MIGLTNVCVIRQRERRQMRTRQRWQSTYDACLLRRRLAHGDIQRRDRAAVMGPALKAVLLSRLQPVNDHMVVTRL